MLVLRAITDDEYEAFRATLFTTFGDDLKRDPDGQLTIARLGKSTLERTVRLLVEGIPGNIANIIQYEAISAAEELDLPVPRVAIEEVYDSPAIPSN